MSIIQKSSEYIYNNCSKYFLRAKVADSTDPSFSFPDNWRFPIIDCHRLNGDESEYFMNEITFIYIETDTNKAADVSIIGTFSNLYEPIPLNRVENSIYYSLTYLIPKGEIHYYQFLVDGKYILDPVNPQTFTMNDGVQWSRFFTQSCTTPVSFERWELIILDRLTDHILPFRTTDARIFMNDYFNNAMPDVDKKRISFKAYLLDQSVGVVNYIDKIVAREEYHRLADYKICLEIIDSLLRKRNPYLEPLEMPREMFVSLYKEMGTGDVPGWDYNRYNSPSFFLKILRRHTLTGAFSHPKYGGNAECAAWEFLSQRYKDSHGETLFNWKLALERPIGESDEYYG